MEEWRAVPGYEGIYEASSLGRIKSLPRRLPTWFGTRACHEKVLRTRVGKNGYLNITLQKRRELWWTTVHAVVATTFLGEAPTGHEVRHLDGNRENCAISNLAWGTRLDNMRDQYRHGTRAVGQRAGIANITQELAEWIRDSSQRGPELHEITGVSLSTISRIKRGISYPSTLTKGS